MSDRRSPIERMVDEACGIKPGEIPSSPAPRTELDCAVDVLYGEPHCTTKEGIDCWVLDRPERDALLKALRRKRR